MVKIIEKTEKEKDLERKVKTLERVTKQAIKDKKNFFNFVSSRDNLIFIHNCNPFTLFMTYSANCSSNSIVIDKKKYFDFASELAQKYEKHTGEEWILKKDYNE